MQIEQLASMPTELAPPTTTTVAAAAAASPKGSLTMLVMAKWRSRGALILYAAMGLALLGCKMFWPEPRDAEASSALSTTSAVKSEPQSQVASKTKTTLAAGPPKPAGADSKSPAKSAGGASLATAGAKKPSSSTSAPVASRAKSKSAASSRPTDPLGALYIDETNGFSMRFPAGWVIRTFEGEPWVIDVGDARVGLISVGFAPFPEAFTTDNLPPDWIANNIKKRHDTTLHGQGYAMIGGRKALWSKSTGPLPMTHAAPRMTRVNYVLPIGDGRVLELRVAASPAQFNRLVPVMKKAIATFKLHTPGTPHQSLANARR